MSGHYEVVFSLFLKDDTPTEVLDDLRWHLGLTDQEPSASAIRQHHPVLTPNEQTYLPGGEVATLRRQFQYTQHGVDHYAWGLHTRLHWGDDGWAHMWWRVAKWHAPYAADNGYAGFYRNESADENPTILVIHDGEPYATPSTVSPDRSAER